MTLFEKIFNYQILSRLEDSGTFMVTSQERNWLKTMLQHPVASDAFRPETLNKLQRLLEPDSRLDFDEHLLQKASSKENGLYHPLIRLLRRAMMNRNGLRLSYGVKNGGTYHNMSALPYKLEYSMVKKEWYLLWYHVKKRMMMSTRLRKLVDVREEPYSTEHYERLLGEALAIMERRKINLDIRVLREYNEELSRILYAFSCFEKKASYDEAADEYTIRIHFTSDEAEYVLSKIRFLGKRVQLIGNERMRHRMRQSATWALQRYGVSDDSTELG